MNRTTYETHPKVHLPIRINHSLHQQFTKISESTLIPKSQLTRISLIRLFHDIETKGITTVLNELESV